jgi:hypothetical protein
MNTSDLGLGSVAALAETRGSMLLRSGRVVSFSSCLFVFWFVALSGFFWRLPSPVYQSHPVYTCSCFIASMWAPCTWSLTFIDVSTQRRAFPHWVCTPCARHAGWFVAVSWHGPMCITVRVCSDAQHTWIGIVDPHSAGPRTALVVVFVFQCVPIC